MRFLADECCNGGLVAALRDDGHDVLYVPELMAGATDEAVLACAFDEERILLTEDKDFGELVYRLQLPAHGIVLIRFEIAERRLKIPRMRELLIQCGERLHGLFVTLEADKIRMRPLKDDLLDYLQGHRELLDALQLIAAGRVSWISDQWARQNPQHRQAQVNGAEDA